MLGNINIEAGESTYSQSSKSNSRNLGGSFGTNGLSANIGFNESQSSFDQTTFSNSQISAINGNLNINTNQDLKIFGANLVASNVNLNIGNNLLLKSKQNLSESDSYNIGASIGLSGNPSGINGGSLGLNLGNGYSNRAFIDQASSIIGNNSVNINVANDTNIAGALIANQNNRGIDLGNLNLKTKSLTYSDLNNFSVSNSNQLSTNLQAGYNPNNPTQKAFSQAGWIGYYSIKKPDGSENKIEYNTDNGVVLNFPKKNEFWLTLPRDSSNFRLAGFFTPFTPPIPIVFLSLKPSPKLLFT